MKTMAIKSVKLPAVGQRIYRSVCGVCLCFAIYYIRGKEGIPFYSALAVLQCIQPYRESSTQMAKQRCSGTFIGAAWGLLLLLLFDWGGVIFDESVFSYLLISLFTGLVLYTTVLLNMKETSYFSCVVFLSVTVMHMGDSSPFLFVMNRVADTLIGVLMAIVVNSVHLPRKKQIDVLYVSGVDDTLLTREEKLTPYSKVELNRLIDNGVKFTLSTGRTPATLMESVRGINLKLPVIVMDGAALYDTNDNSYLLTYVLSYDQAEKIINLLNESNLNYFANVVIDDLLVIYYEKLDNQAEQGIYQKLRKDPLRNYVKRRLPQYENVVYFMVIDTTEQIKAAYQNLMDQEWSKELKIRTYESKEYPGFSYIKIYNKDANREHMLQNLKAMLDMEKSVMFGSVPGQCDILIENSSNNDMVKRLKREFEPVNLLWGNSRDH
jgi:hydroxymethylpyrimidine pyrophosphatase-like HAD family hydrolase